ncbi:hypothetical protein LDO26_06095 [Luteimonas sp. BDR2-5]|uniref:hypothetical protein n=1 Tax=Proluteimonas luteida TaxID=2878685 RepID=UPI001E307903|nr:hypothetical protein [Luteimonas sp. BDR2-5]MCD9027773.1 hypothetical protein [Luteimonas sp. BDR2-5]
MRPPALLAGACLALALCACNAEPPAATPIAAAAAPDDVRTDVAAPSPAGRYRMADTHQGTLTLVDEGAGYWRVSLHGGSAAGDGAAAAADCEIQARGTLRDGRIDAAVVPFDGELMSVSQADLDRQPATVTVALDGELADVATDFALCGIGAELSGRYRRNDN